MNDKKVCIIIGSVLLLLCIVLGACFAYQTYRLDKSRLELESVRAELARASDKQRLIEDCIARTDTILDQSFTTIAGIREQIRAIRESYQEMEDILYSRDSYDGIDDISCLQ